MKIESIEVIPMSKESRFEDAEETAFVTHNITTDFETWFSTQERHNRPYDKDTIKFAKKQHAFMLAITAMFGTLVYGTRSIQVDSLDDVILSGPLFSVHSTEVFDEVEGIPVFQPYIDPYTFETKIGLSYPEKGIYRKKVYKVVYGVVPVLNVIDPVA
jgi:hypothetical protein